LLIPVSFLNGGVIFRWSKLRWAAAFVTSVAMFVFLLIPLEESWGQADAAGPWIFSLIGYSLFAVALWAFFAYRKKLIPAKSGRRSAD